MPYTEADFIRDVVKRIPVAERLAGIPLAERFADIPPAEVRKYLAQLEKTQPAKAAPKSKAKRNPPRRTK